MKNNLDLNELLKCKSMTEIYKYIDFYYYHHNINHFRIFKLRAIEISFCLFDKEYYISKRSLVENISILSNDVLIYNEPKEYFMRDILNEK